MRSAFRLGADGGLAGKSPFAGSALGLLLLLRKGLDDLGKDQLCELFRTDPEVDRLAARLARWIMEKQPKIINGKQIRRTARLCSGLVMPTK